MKRLLLIFLLVFVSEAHSKCNFLTGNYIKEISDPSQILSIKIDIPKNSDYAKNIMRIIVSKSEIIPSKLRKNFKANLSVHYKFGSCNYSARIRQSGDSRSHLKAIGKGQFVRSLDVKLKQGNIMNAVNFKLLLPETRNGVHEILASLILKKLNFISPETFEVQTSVNDVDAVMLFQEKPAKELLEKNLRREGPIFEGDESLLWGYKNYYNFELEPLALSRVINDNWFNKGNNSRAITINSFSKLQHAYLNYAFRNLSNKTEYALFPNKLKNNIFINYHALLYSMNGIHALRPHNRQYYFNSFESTFEPIYYDGNVDFLNPVNLSNISELESLIPNKLNDEFLELVNFSINYEQLYDDFIKRVSQTKIAKDFLQNSLNQFKGNLKAIELKTKNLEKKEYIKDIQSFTGIDWYQEFQHNKKVEQKIITKIVLNENSHVLSFKDRQSHEVSSKDLARVLSRNKSADKRVVYISSKKQEGRSKDIKYLSFENKLIKMSKNMKIKFDENAKTIRFIQSNPLDWAFISGSDYSNWKIFFDGMPNFTYEKKNSTQRFNEYGLTGCLTIYKSLINKTFFSMINGVCEDSINIINSKGEEVSLIVKNAFADAFDADFSKISIKSLRVKNSGNDCIDVSGGDYVIENAFLDICVDKAISVGEKSKLIANKIFVTNSNIAIAAKDLSTVKISLLDAKDVDLCAEIKQKKQEFGGANLSINNLNCAAPIDISSESKYSESLL